MKITVTKGKKNGRAKTMPMEEDKGIVPPAPEPRNPTR